MRAAHVLIEGEQEQDFRKIQQRMEDALRPEGEMEAFLAARVVKAYWRLARIPRLEKELFSTSPLPYGRDREGPGAVFRAEGRGGMDSFARLSRYEREIEHGMFRALHELQRLQACRKGTAPAPPRALDVLVDAPP